MNIYDIDGFLNIPEIAKTGAWLIVLISSRQRFGKTYGVLKYMLDNDLTHILLRRTSKELERITSSQMLDPYNKFKPEYSVGLFSTSDMAEICDYTAGEDAKPIKGKRRGLCMSLPQIAGVRGFDGSAFTDLVFDEFIPEKGSYQRSTEGEATLNAYYTINGNREDQGNKPLRLWLLANANDINSPILEAFNLQDDVIELQKKRKEYILKDNGVLVVIPRGNRKADARAATAINSQIRSDSEFYKMAVGNEFSYDESPLITNLPIKHMKPLFSYDLTLYAWEYDKGVYICRAPHKTDPYTISKWDRAQLAANYLWMKRYYYEGLVMFSDLRLLSMFRQLFDIEL